MKLILVVAVLAGCAHALPVHIGRHENVTLAYNDRAERSFGFASFAQGTTGGQGGSVWTVWDAWALRSALIGADRRIIQVRGRIDLTVLFTGSPGVWVDVQSRKTIVGGDANAEITGGGIRIRNGQQVIIQNIKFTNAISYAPGERPNGWGGIVSQAAGEFTDIDSILCEQAEFVWIDHCEFSDDPWIASTVPNNRMRHDGLIDIKRASNWITVSHNIFRNHNKVMLIGHSDNNAAQDRGKLKVSVQANWFQGVTQRNPRVRYGEVHIVNNLYTNIGTYGIGVGAGASVYAERNAFIDSRAWRHPDGTPNPMGFLVNDNNLLRNSNFDAVPSNGVTWHPRNYFSYATLAANDVEWRIRQIAGTW